jgi:hypothetical protein
VGGEAGGGPGGGVAPPPAATFPEHANVVSPFPKGGGDLDARGTLLANILLAINEARLVLPGAAAVYSGVEGLIRELDKGGAGCASTAPPESLESQKQRVGREFDQAVKECDRSSRALQRQFHVVARAQETHSRFAAEAVAAADKRERLEGELEKLWGDRAAERMGIRVQELDAEMLAEREGEQGEMDQQVAAGVFAPVLGRDLGELWPERDDRPGTRTPGADQVEQEAGEERDMDAICGVRNDDDMEGDGERAGKVRRQEDQEEDSERGYAVRDSAGDVWAVESKEVEGDKGGAGSLLAKGMGGKAVGGAAVGGGKVNVNATIRKP